MRKTVLTGISALAIAFSLPAMAESANQDAPTKAQIEEVTEGTVPVADELNAAAAAGETAEEEMQAQADGAEAGADSAPVNPVAELPADEIMGRELVTADGEKAGDVKNVLLDRNSQVTHVVVGVGGFFGFGAKPVSVPVQQLALADEQTLAVDMTLDQLKSLPKYQSKVE